MLDVGSWKHSIKLKKSKVLMKEIIEDVNRDILCSLIGRFNIIKMSALPKLMCRFNEIPIKLLASVFFFFVDIKKLILKLMWKGTGPRIAKNNPEKRE